MSFSSALPPRLLSLLSAIEAALAQQGAAAVSQPAQRSISFHKGLARMVFSDGSGSITLQSFILADGQICLRASFAWAGTAAVGTHAIYPRDAFDWAGAADFIATSWQTGQENAVRAAATASEGADPSMESMAAAG